MKLNLSYYDNKKNSIIHLFIGLIGSRKKQDDKSSAGVEHGGEASSRQILRISGPLPSTFPFIVLLTQFSHSFFFFFFGVVVDQSVEKQHEAIRNVFSGLSHSH